MAVSLVGRSDASGTEHSSAGVGGDVSIYRSAGDWEPVYNFWAHIPIPSSDISRAEGWGCWHIVNELLNNLEARRFVRIRARPLKECIIYCDSQSFVNRPTLFSWRECQFHFEDVYGCKLELRWGNRTSDVMQYPHQQARRAAHLPCGMMICNTLFPERSFDMEWLTLHEALVGESNGCISLIGTPMPKRRA